MGAYRLEMKAAQDREPHKNDVYNMLYLDVIHKTPLQYVNGFH